MSFAQYETSASAGEPINLYQFRYGPGPADVLAFTDAEQDRVFDDGITGPVTYKAIAIEHDEVTVSGTLDRSATEVRTSDDSELADLFRLYPPSQVVSVTIFQGHANDADAQFLVEYGGRVIGFGSEADQARYTCEPISTAMRRAGLRRRWQYGCPHVLYGQGPGRCNANKAAATENHVVLGVAGSVLTLAPTWSNRKAKFLGGLAEWTRADGRSEVRTILTAAEDGTIVLSGYAAGLAPGSAISLVLGCNHKAGVGPQPDGDCLPLHGNVQNFGGQMWIPSKSPFGLHNNFY